MSAEALGAAWWRQQVAQLSRPNIIWVAFSGGLDSTVLLHSLARARAAPLKAVHVDHQLQSASGRWARRCREQARRWGVEFQGLTVDCSAQGEGPEAAARRARYEALAQLLGKGDYCAVAHHRDDQAETVLYRLLRGSGVEGLAGMAPLRPLGRAQLWRPLLGLPRSLLRDYARQHRISWIEDPQNQDQRYSRVWLRRELLPQLERRFPEVAERLAQTAAHSRDAAELVQQQAEQDMARARIADGGLDLRRLAQLAAARQRGLLRAWLSDQGLQPSTQQLQRILAEVIAARVDATPVFRLGERELRRYRQGLWCMARLSEVPAMPSAKLRIGSVRLRAGAGLLRITAGPSLPQLHWRFAQGGERLKLAGEAHHRSLKSLHQAAANPPWLRERMPLIYLQDQLISVAGRWNAPAWIALERRHGLQLEWRHRLPGDPEPENPADGLTPGEQAG